MYMLNPEALKRTYTNEQILVILLTRIYFNTQEIEEVRDFTDHEVIDWGMFYKLISINDIRSFIYNILTVSQIAIDPQIYDTLKKDTMGITLFVSYQAGLLTHLKAEFEKMGIKVIPYKGNTLAARYYKSPFLRESSDIDFLINKDEFLQLRNCLYENGYVSGHNVSAHQMAFIMRFQRELSFKAPKSKMGISCSVELQWKLLDRYFGQFHQYDFFVQHLQSYTAVDGTTQVGLAPTYDFICVASHHLIKEPLMRFKQLIDLACIVQTSSSQLDWKEINTQFKLHNFSAFLWSGMNALEEIIGLQLSVSNTPVVAYHLFTATETRDGREYLFRKNELINLKLSFLKKIKFSLKTRLSLLVPNVKDLAATNAPAWTIPLIIPVKSLRFLYAYLTKKG